MNALERDAQEAASVPLAELLGQDGRCTLHGLTFPLSRLPRLLLRHSNCRKDVSYIRWKYGLDLDCDLFRLDVEHHGDRFAGSLIGLL